VLIAGAFGPGQRHGQVVDLQLCGAGRQLQAVAQRLLASAVGDGVDMRQQRRCIGVVLQRIQPGQPLVGCHPQQAIGGQHRAGYRGGLGGDAGHAIGGVVQARRGFLAGVDRAFQRGSVGPDQAAAAVEPVVAAAVARDPGDAFEHPGAGGQRGAEAAVTTEQGQAVLACDPGPGAHEGGCGHRAHVQAVGAGVVAVAAVVADPQRAIRVTDHHGTVVAAGQRGTRQRRQGRVLLPAAPLVVQHGIGVEAEPGLVRAHCQHRAQLQRRGDTRRCQRRAPALVDPQQGIPLGQPQRLRGGLRRGQAVRRGRIQQVAAQRHRLQVLAVAEHLAARRAEQGAQRIGRAGQRQRPHLVLAEAVQAQVGAYPEIAFAVLQQRSGGGGGQSLRGVEALDPLSPVAVGIDMEDAPIGYEAAPQAAIGGKADAPGQQPRQPVGLAMRRGHQPVRIGKRHHALLAVGQPHLAIAAQRERGKP